MIFFHKSDFTYIYCSVCTCVCYKCRRELQALPFIHTDIISSLKSGDSPTGNGSSVDTSLSLNDLSNSTSSVVPVDRMLKDEEPEIFSKLSPDQFSAKGEN